MVIARLPHQTDLPESSIVELNGSFNEPYPVTNPGQFDSSLHLKKRKIYGLFKATHIHHIHIEKNQSIRRIAQAIRTHIIRTINASFPAPYNALIFGLIFGDRGAPLPAEIMEKYSLVGLIHLMVVSGSQVTLVATLCLGLLRYITPNKWTQWIILSAINTLFYFITGGGPSIMRAMFMVGIYQFFEASETKRSPPHLIAAVAILMLIPNPLLIHNTGFQLSFLATSSLVMLRPILDQALSTRLPQWMATLMASALAPFIMTTPLLWHLNHSFSLLSLISNLMASVWIEWIVIIGFCSTILSLIHIPIYKLLNNACLGLLIALENLVNHLQNLQSLIFHIPPPPFPLLMGWYGWVYCLVIKHPSIIKFACLWSGLYIGYCVILPLTLPPFITVLDVGQGDCIIIRTPQKKVIMIDTGHLYSKNKPLILPKIIRPFLNHHHIRTIDALIITHFDQDHSGNLHALLKTFPVKHIIHNESKHFSAKDWNNDQIQTIPITIKSPNILNLDASTTLTLLPNTTKDLASRNNQSLIIRVDINGHSLLLPGDIEAERESIEHSKHPQIIDTDILLVPHHGSKTSSTIDFIKQVSPKFAIISCGKQNRYGHPHPDILSRLDQLNIPVLSTATHGAIHLSLKHNEPIHVTVGP